MADNTELPSGSGGDTLRTLEDTNSIKWPAGVTAYATTVGTPDVLEVVTLTSGLPVQPQTGATFTVTGAGGTFPVTDNSGSLTVDAPVATPVFVRLSDGAAAISTLPVSLASVPSHAVTNAGTFAVQAAQSGTWTVDLGATDNAVLDAIAASLAGTLTVGSHAVTNAGTFAVQVDGAALTALQLIDDAVYTDDIPFTAGSNKVMAAGFRYDDVTPDTVQQGDIGYARMSSRREVFVAIRDAAGNERGLNVDASGNITVNVTGTVTVASHAVTNAGTFAVQVDGAALTSLQLIDNIVLAEDAAHASADPGVQMLAVRKATPANLSGTDGDYEPLQVSAGRLWAAATVEPAATAVGLDTFRATNLTNTSQAVKASAGNLYSVHIENSNSSKAYVQFYDLASGSVTVGTSTPKKTLFIPPNGAYDFDWAIPVAFATAISIAATTTATGSTAPTNNLLINCDYK